MLKVVLLVHLSCLWSDPAGMFLPDPTSATCELQNTRDTSVSFKMEAKKHCNKCSAYKNCFKNYVKNTSKKLKLFSSMLARDTRTDIHDKVDEPNKLNANKFSNKRSISKRLEEQHIRAKISKTKDKDVSEVLTVECSGLVPVGVKMIPLMDITDHINGEEDESRRSTGIVIKQKKCHFRLNKIKISSRDCDIKISSIDLKRHLQRKRSRVNLKRLKLPHQLGLGSKISSHNNNSRFNGRVGINRLKPNPKTLKERKTNEEILRHFSQDHCDDMFEAEASPSYVSKFNLMDCSFSSDTSDEEVSSLARPHTPLTKHLAHFGGWSAKTPDHVRGEDEDEVKQAEGELSQLAFVHKTLDDRKKGHKIMGKRIPNNLEDHMDSVFSSDKYSTPLKSKPQTLKDLLGDLEPALENQDESQQDISIDEVEPYFE